jgi:hypothetical protein
MNGALDRERLARVLGMLGSKHDGEALAAARQGERLRHQAGVTWHDIIILPVLPAPAREREIETIDDAIDFCVERADDLREWEEKFVRSLDRQRHRRLTKQITVLEELVEKCRRAEARAAS